MKIDRTVNAPEPGYPFQDREGAYILAVEDGKLAVADVNGKWFLPGGGIDPGETHEACIKRECLEELGYAAQIGDYLGCADAYLTETEDGPLHLIQFYYAGTLGEKVQEPVERDHVFRWVSVEEAAKGMKLEMQRWAVGRLLEKTS